MLTITPFNGAPVLRLFIGYLYVQGDTVFSSDGARDVPLPGRVLRQEDASRLQGDLTASRHFDFSPSTEGNNVLVTFRDVPVVEPARRRTCELQTDDFDVLRGFQAFSGGVGSKSQVGNHLSMALSVGTGVEAGDGDGLVALSR